MKWIDRLFGASLVMISLSSLVVTVTGLAGIPLPLWAGRVLGVVNLVSLPVLLYSCFLSIKEKLAATKNLRGKGLPGQAKAGALSPSKQKKKKKKKK